MISVGPAIMSMPTRPNSARLASDTCTDSWLLGTESNPTYQKMSYPFVAGADQNVDRGPSKKTYGKDKHMRLIIVCLYACL